MSAKRLQAQATSCKSEPQPSRDQRYEYLAESSPKDARWDPLKVNSRRMAAALAAAEDLRGRGERMHPCADLLTFALKKAEDFQSTGELRFHLKHASFCRDRMCETCQMLRSRTWQSQFRKLAPSLLKQYPGARWLVHTLTVKNPDVTKTRETLHEMGKAWK
ncbi:MAG: protein rep, partial [Clostridia bacterium]|nr:protein rep [Clostridia bacterium]